MNKTFYIKDNKMVNFLAASLTNLSVLLVLMCWTTGSNGAAFSFEEEFLQLKTQMIQIVKSFESKVAELESKDVQMQEKDAKMQERVTELEAKVREQDSLLFGLREKNERLKTNSAPIITHESAVAINGLPSSCSDLRMAGHIWSGIYSVMGTAKMESVYCDFTKLPTDPGFEKWIGYADVKSAPVHFYVQRNDSFRATFTPITFQLARVNEGNAMDLTSGKFTAPRNGIYFFSFLGHSTSSFIFVSLYLNGGLIGSGNVEINTDFQRMPLTLQSTLNLKKGDQVWVQIWGVSAVSLDEGIALNSDNVHMTHFMGFMLEEEIVSSFLKKI